MKIKNPFSSLTKFEWALYIISSLAVLLSAIFCKHEGILSVLASFVGVTALIFVARGDVFGQILTLLFSVLYAVISYSFDYYGEMMTYLCMTAPIAAMSVVSWIRHPYKNSSRVEVSVLSKLNRCVMVITAAAVTAVFYFILRHFGNANLTVSTVSITTSYLASYLMLFRSPCYAIAYAANDIVLIVLWIMATHEDIKYISMVVCFAAFLLNDLYGFYNWRKMMKIQE